MSACTRTCGRARWCTCARSSSTCSTRRAAHDALRLFVAIDPPHDAIEHLRHRLDLVPGLRWTDPEQWHLTLTFCGEVDEKTAAELSLRLARAAARQAP